jgi:dihydrolipoamide dehydrogenase
VTIEGQEIIYAHRIILATGSTPIMPPQFDVDRTKVMTSNEILELSTLPESILIVGGGYIGCEYATIFSNYGVDVTLIELLPTILNTEDDDVVNEVLRSFKKREVKVYTGTGLDLIEINGGGVKSILSNGCILITDIVLIAVGRSPNSHELGLEKLGIQLNEKGAIGVNERFRTNRNDVYAIGDVIDRELRLAHVSEKEGVIGISNIIRDMNFGPMSYDVIPTAIFVEPEVASVGKREFQLKKECVAHVIGKSWYAKNAMAQCSGSTTGFVKLIVDKTTLKILGATIVGNHASDLIGTIATAMNADTTINTLIDSVWFHPSRPEAIKEAAKVAWNKTKE